MAGASKHRTYFVSDAHLGSRVVADNRAHERKLVRWLDSIQTDAESVYLMGDMFDFWFEYERTVPKGFNRFLGKLAEMVDAGIEIHFFTGNHDLWTFGYLEREIGLTIHRKPEIKTIYGKQFFLAHGDGLSDESKKFAFVRAIFHSRCCQFLFRTCIPANWGLKFGYAWSENNRRRHLREDCGYQGEEREPLVLFAKKHVKTNPQVDFYVFGHRHILLNLMLGSKSRLVVLGDFMQEFSYAVFDGAQFEIYNFEGNGQV